MSETLATKHCTPCEGGTPKIDKPAAEKLLENLKDWMLVSDAHLLVKEFRFKDFAETMQFVNKIAEIAEAENHHPDITINYNHLMIELSTHAAKGLTENDFILAAKIDQIML